MYKKFMKRLLVLVAALCMTFTMSMPVLADDTTDPAGSSNATTEDPADGVLQVWLSYVDDNGNETLISGGSCFLINEEYVLSNYHIFNLNFSEDGVTLREYAMDLLGLDELKDDDPHLKIRVYANRDMSVTATIHDSVQSEALDYVALKLSDKIYDRKSLVLGDSDAVRQTDTVYAYGFPADSISTKQFNTKTDVSATDGSISKITVSNPADMFEHTAQLNKGNSGGPLMNVDREVIGINTQAIGNGLGSKYYATQVNVIKSGLDTFGIAYTSSDGMTGSTGGATEDPDDSVAETTEPDPTLISELNSQITSARAVATDGYTEESVQILNDTIGAAESVAGNTEATNAQVQTAIDDLKAAVNGLEEKQGVNMLLIGGIAAAVIVVIIVVVIIVVMSSKKKKANTVGMMGAGGQQNFQPQNTPPQNFPPQGGANSTVYQQSPVQEPEGAGETTLLDSGAGETTLLGNGGGGAYLIRKKNGEKIAINSQNFSIGKERRKVNYCVSDNTSVSRYHVVITKKGSDYFAADQKSSNFTFVNGVQLSPYQETLLTDKSVLKLSDEEFEFHLL